MKLKVHVIVPAKWHNNPSAQRQSSACPLRKVSNVLYGGSWGLIAKQGPPRATHPTEVVTISMYVIPMASSCTMQLVHIVATASPIVTSSHRDSRGTSKAVAGDGSLHRQAITSQKPGGGTTSCAISRGPVGDMDSGFVSSTHWCSSTLQHQDLLPPELWLQGLHLDSWDIRGACPAAVTGLEGCNTSLHPQKWVGDPTLLVCSLLGVWRYWVPPEVSQWGPLLPQQPLQWGVGRSWLGTPRNGCLWLVLQESFQWGYTAQDGIIRERDIGSITSLNSRMLPTKRHGWPGVGGLDFSTQDWRACT